MLVLGTVVRTVLRTVLRTGHVGLRTMVVTSGDRRHRLGPGGPGGTSHYPPPPRPALQPTLNTERVAGDSRI